MAIVSVQDDFNQSAEAQVDENGDITYMRRMRVIVDDQYDGPNTVMTAVDPSTAKTIPTIGSLYSYGNDLSTYAIASQINVQRAAWNLWWVEIRYTKPDPGKGSTPNNPLSWPARVTTGSEPYTEIFEKDVETGDPVLNSAGQKFLDPPPISEKRRPTLTIRQNVASADIDLKIEYEDSINSGTFLGQDAEICRVGSIDYDGPHEQNEISYWVRTLYIILNKDGWKRKILDIGTGELQDGQLTTIIDDLLGEPVLQPVLLNMMGQKLPDGEDPKFLEFDEYPKKSFAVFGVTTAIFD